MTRLTAAPPPSPEPTNVENGKRRSKAFGRDAATADLREAHGKIVQMALRVE